jgi:lysophospholipase L1-like esterase
MTIRRLSLAAGLGLALVAAGCQNDELFTPLVPAYKGGAMFIRYVAMGNSITAGFQSGGINDTSQLQSYVRMVANAMGTAYYYPELVFPGCPPPFTNIFTNTRLGGATATTCYFRSSNIPPYLSNVAVPEAEVLDIAHNGPGAGTNSNPLTQLFLGGRTQVQAMAAARPTFVSVWIGNNDVLGSILSPTNAGDSTLITPLATFQSEYQEIVDSINAVKAKALLIGVANVTEIPFVSQGQIYFLIRNGLVPGQPGDTFPSADSLFHVDPLCAPSAFGGKGDSVLVPFPFGGALLAAAQAGVNDTLHCTEPQTVQPAELVKILTTVAAYNAFISSTAAANGWAYLDPNPALDSLRGVPNQVAPFPNFGFPCSTSPFGLAFSCDGFHPSTATHRLIAKKVVQAINATYSSAIPNVP